MSFTALLKSIRHICSRPEGSLPLHAPVFRGKEREYVLDTLESTYVSSVGAYVDRFEELLCELSGAAYAVAAVNGTAALQVALRLAGTGQGDLVATQALSFVATSNAILHAGGVPVFLDVDEDNLGLSPAGLAAFLENHCRREAKGTVHIKTGKRVAACVPMHTFGFACRIDEICSLCAEWDIAVVEDAAEALGSTYKGHACGTFGKLGVLSFNGNKIVTTGGGGAILTNDSELGVRAKSLTTTAKRPHPWEFYHTEPAWNFRLPNLNAALGCAQLERLPEFLSLKRARAKAYQELFSGSPWRFLSEPDGCRSNYWLCSVLFRDRNERDAFLSASNESGVMTRPVWEPLHTLPVFRDCLRGDLSTTMSIASRLVNLPSGVRDLDPLRGANG